MQTELYGYYFLFTAESICWVADAMSLFIAVQGFVDALSPLLLSHAKFLISIPLQNVGGA
jgi:hypothetical protein